MNVQNGNAAPAGKPRTKRGISGSTLKLIAVISMVIDHTAAGILGRYLMMSGLGSLDVGNVNEVQQWIVGNAQLFSIYNVMRMIGRIAFPIYCFLLVEGLAHTRNRMKYAGRLLLFAAVSELPFDLLFKGAVLEFSYQNVFFTLFFGVAVMIGIEWAKEQYCDRPAIAAVLTWAVIAAGMAAAQLANTDYAAIGVFCIVVIYLCRKKKVWQIVAGCIVFAWELTAPLAFVPIGFYNGRRGWKLKYFFYLIYPVHLLILYMLCMYLGIASYPAM
ncbi:MAG: conjugal transfer protein TraX [Eubacterium sp.]|nr:conjugal transfer protein TraX [Eubacterium sp.]